MQKLKLHTPDLTAANIDRIAALFPNCVTFTDDGVRFSNGSLAISLTRP